MVSPPILSLEDGTVKLALRLGGDLLDAAIGLDTLGTVTLVLRRV
jgi:hypothetical protein